ncbi:MAG: RNA 2',3'-cyclic phosphodiesterase [archaeon]|jgi:2'-5' RNA ligase
MKRLFVAIELPKKLRETIEKELIEPLNTVKKVPATNLHITLCFLGDANEAGEKEILKRLSQIKFEPFQILIGTIGQFDERVIWLSAEARELYDLAEGVSKTLGTDSEFSGHITIARANDGTDFAKEFSKIKNKRVYQTLKVKNFALFESKLTPEGSVYSKVEDFPKNEEKETLVKKAQKKK